VHAAHDCLASSINVSHFPRSCRPTIHQPQLHQQCDLNGSQLVLYPSLSAEARPLLSG